MKNIEIYTDGACHGNPGPGGWGAILRHGVYEKKISGTEEHTTNNRMEITALIKALKLVKQPCKITIYSDSQYVCNAIKNGWATKWQQNGWIKNKKQPAKNSDLWEQLLKLLEIHEVKMEWIKGHAGHPENERCDELANLAIKKKHLN